MQRLVFGTAALGLPYGLAAKDGEKRDLVSTERALALVAGALDMGITTFDTAPAYGDAEARLGLALGNRGTVWTKVGEERCVESVERSLRLLRRDRLDLVQWHNWTRQTGQSENFQRCWQALREHSAIGALGASTYGIDDARAAVASGFFAYVQIEWNVLNRSVLRSIAGEVARQNVTLALRSVLLQGALTTEGRSLPNRTTLVDGVRRAGLVASELNVTVEHLAIRAALDQREVRVVLGFDRLKQLQAAVTAANAEPIDSERLTALDMSPDDALDPRTWALSC